MKTRTALRMLLATALVLSLGAVAAGAEEDAATRLYLRNDASGCPGYTFLSQEAGTEDVNCGYIHGAPLGEAYFTLGESTNHRTYTTLPEEGTYAVDTVRDVAGQLTIRNGRPDPEVPTRIGVGEVVADLALTGETLDGALVDLGSVTVSGTATPGTNAFEIPFTFDLDEAAGQLDLKGLTLKTDVRGKHLYSGYTGANDTSWLDVPVVPVVEEVVAP